jgi:ethanolamine utilization protein EutN
MFLAKVTKRVVAVEKHPAYVGKKLYVVQPILPDGTSDGDEWVAMDYVQAGIGDTVICGGAPGVAKTVFGLERAPIRTLIMAIVDRIEFHDMESPSR